ncbi:MAG: hypothetical protein LBS83_01070 [Holosporales bacterium]|nr:hypothetical protein [Holosporales bacterium]
MMTICETCGKSVNKNNPQHFIFKKLESLKNDLNEIEKSIFDLESNSENFVNSSKVSFLKQQYIFLKKKIDELVNCAPPDIIA